MTTIADVARRANVSAMTVSRVINDTAAVNDATRQRVLSAMEELNYVPNSIARSLISGKTNTIGLVLADLANPFFTTIARGAEDTAHLHRHRLIICNHDDDASKEREYIDALISARVDGMIIVPASDASRDSLQQLACHHIPYVMLDRLVAGIQADHIIGDNRNAAYRLTSHLIDQGHKHIAIINGPQQIYTAHERFQGYVAALTDHNVPVRQGLIKEASFGPYTSRTQEDAQGISGIMHDWMQGDAIRPTALVAANNMVAIEVLHSLETMHLRCPNDVALVCFEDIDPHGLLRPSVTAATQPAYEYGHFAMKMLFERLTNPDCAVQSLILRSEIHYRNSSLASYNALYMEDKTSEIRA